MPPRVVATCLAALAGTAAAISASGGDEVLTEVRYCGDLPRVLTATCLAQPALEAPTSSAIINLVTTHAASDSGAAISATAGERDRAHGAARAHGSLGAGRDRMALEHEDDHGFEGRHGRRDPDRPEARIDDPLTGGDERTAKPGGIAGSLSLHPPRSATSSRPRWRTPPRASGASTISRRRAGAAARLGRGAA